MLFILKEYIEFQEKEIDMIRKALKKEDTDIQKCSCDKTVCVKSRNIGKFCKYGKHIVQEEYLHG